MKTRVLHWIYLRCTQCGRTSFRVPFVVGSRPTILICPHCQSRFRLERSTARGLFAGAIVGVMALALVFAVEILVDPTTRFQALFDLSPIVNALSLALMFLIAVYLFRPVGFAILRWIRES